MIKLFVPSTSTVTETAALINRICAVGYEFVGITLVGQYAETSVVEFKRVLP